MIKNPKENIDDENEHTTKPTFVPDSKFLSALMEMGFSKNISLRALLVTGNSSLESAANWAMEHSNLNDTPLTESEILAHTKNKSTSFDEKGDVFSAELFTQIYGNAKEDFKLVLCVRQDLKMSIGKIAAQCAHATLGVYRRMQHSCPAILKNWERSGEKKVVVGISSSEELEKLEINAMNHNLPTHIVRDAGHTEIQSGTRTVLGIAGPAGTVDLVTSHLKLL
eukprot:TRINITY_DN2735_c0_g1_i5.p1 TRINITY_DN2735_c0_g1~~TRINITY_DN2735_c0_g1_i5.p1  ORF type:complete len:224 (-),score=38.86 TRINITY_DN2735_c0_g1_i5:161-832(-)